MNRFTRFLAAGAAAIALVVGGSVAADVATPAVHNELVAASAATAEVAPAISEGLATAADVVAPSVAEAVNLSRVQHCNWPQKATITVRNNNTGYIRLEAYSPTGWHLGTYTSSLVNFNWNTPWEDVTVFGYTSDNTWQIGGFCRF